MKMELQLLAGISQMGWQKKNNQMKKMSEILLIKY